MSNNIPSTVIKRNQFGLLEGIDYIFDDKTGLVNWRAMIDPIYLRINNSYKDIVSQKLGKPISEIDAREVEDKYLLILLDGVKSIARIRGYESVDYELKTISDNFVASICHIRWIGNYETENRVIDFSDGADATITNSSGFGKSFLSTVSINRAFVRSVRNFLGINILGHDEISAEIKPEEIEPAVVTPSSDPYNMLDAIMKQVPISFEKLKAVCHEKGDDVEGWESIKNIPKIKVFELINRLSKKLEKK